MALQLRIDIEAAFAQVTDALKAIESQTQKTATTVKSILGTLGVGLSFAGAAAFIKSVADSQEALYKLSITTGETVERLAQLRSLAKTTGTDFDGVADAMAKLSRNMSTSGENTATVSGAFKFLGISARDASGNLKPIGDVMTEIAKKLVTYQDGAGKVAVVQDLLGKGAANLIPYLEELGKATDLQTKVTRESVDAAHEFELQLREMEKQSLATKNALGNELIPILSDVLRTFNELKSAGGWLAVVFGTKEEIEDPLTALRGAEEKLKSLQKSRADFDKAHPLAKLFSSEDAPSFDAAIALQKERIEVLQKLAVIQSNRRPVPPGFGDTDAPVAPTKPKLNYNRKDPKNISEDAGLGALADARARIEIDRAKFSADTQLQLLDKLHANSLISEQHFWDERFRIQKSAADVELAAAEKLVTERQALVNRSGGEKPSIQNAAQKGLEEARANVAKLKAQQARDQVLNSIDQEEAVLRIQLENGQKLIKMYEDQVAVTERAKDVVQDFTDARRLDTQEQEFALALVGQSVAAQENLIGLRRIELDFRRAAAALPNGGDGQAEALEQLRLKAEAAKVSFIALYDAIREKSRSAFTGAVDALTDYIDHATNAAEQTRNALTNAFKSAEDALVEFAKTGKLNFKALADSIITDLIRIQARQAIAGLGKAALPFFQTGPAGGSGIEAKGDAFSRGNIIPFASGGIVNSPTLFRMANGAGLMGEAGPEAIMPLRRGSDGKLGVVAQRVNAAAPVVNVNTTFTQATNPAEMAALMGPLVTRAVQAGILRQQQPGGSLAR